MKFSRYIMSIAFTIATLGGLGSALAHSGATGIVKERMDMFKRSQKNLKAIKSHIRAEDYGSIAKLADEIREWAVKMPEYFPEGSNVKPSEASPNIWEDFSGFKRAAIKNETATKKLDGLWQFEPEPNTRALCSLEELLKHVIDPLLCELFHPSLC